MKPSSIIKILIKAISIPIIAMFALNKWNFCEYITFIPEDYQFEAGMALYMAVLEAISEFIEYFIAKNNAIITCIFYTDERREDSHIKPIIQMSDNSMGVASIWCHIILNGSYKNFKKKELYIDIPQWFSVQLEANSSLKQENRQIKWDISALLPEHDNGKEIYTEIRMKISFIRNEINDVSIFIEPTIKKSRGLKLVTNGVTIQNVGGLK